MCQCLDMIIVKSFRKILLAFLPKKKFETWKNKTYNQFMGTENKNARGRGLRKNKKVYITLIASYAALMLLLLGALAGLFLLAASSITEQLRQVNREVAQKAVDMMDSETDAIFTRAGVILTDERIKRLKNCDTYEPDETVLLMQLDKIIKQELVRETLVKEIYVYFEILLIRTLFLINFINL